MLASIARLRFTGTPILNPFPGSGTMNLQRTVNSVLTVCLSLGDNPKQLARLDRKRKKKGSNDDWQNPHDPDAQITKMKDGRTHLAHKAEHAVDLETGAVIAVTLQPATAGDTNTVHETLAQCGEHIREVAAAVEQ
ncbi:MAG TPA: hypothetical protein VG077_18425, partial [Verrucomicrobiae bacterium]|nr:hypothetical protein [Verrucomicrobiae bacterium]